MHLPELDVFAFAGSGSVLCSEVGVAAMVLIDISVFFC